MLSFDGGTHDPGKFDLFRAWVRDSIEAARRLDGAGGAYLGFSGDAPDDAGSGSTAVRTRPRPAQGGQETVRPRQPLPRQQQHHAVPTMR
jgi:hypothetical protein